MHHRSLAWPQMTMDSAVLHSTMESHLVLGLTQHLLLGSLIFVVSTCHTSTRPPSQ
jgi:hypothetical protein